MPVSSQIATQIATHTESETHTNCLPQAPVQVPLSLPSASDARLKRLVRLQQTLRPRRIPTGTTSQLHTQTKEEGEGAAPRPRRPRKRIRPDTVQCDVKKVQEESLKLSKQIASYRAKLQLAELVLELEKVKKQYKALVKSCPS